MKIRDPGRFSPKWVQTATGALVAENTKALPLANIPDFPEYPPAENR